MLIIPARLWEQIAVEAESAYPEECCGVLLGCGGVVALAARMRNTSPTDRRKSYRIDPVELLDAWRGAHSRGLRVLAVYHSHPECEPDFSEEDATRAYPWLAYLVLAVRDKRAGAARCYRHDEQAGSFKPAGFQII